MQTRSSGALTLLLRPKGKFARSLPKNIAVAPSSTTTQVYEQVATQIGLSTQRLRLTLAGNNTVLPNSASTLTGLNVRDQDTIIVKDLGPQIAWRTVFLIEYLGPILIHIMIYFGRDMIYTNRSLTGHFPAPSGMQKLSLIMVLFHFIKRELETLFVHRFSLDTMPVFNVFKNSAHYWFLSGANIAYWTYSPDAKAAKSQISPLTYAAIAIFLVGEAGNFDVHLTLRNLRRPGSKERRIPKSLLFSLVPVTCPNYFFEVTAWVGMLMVNLSWSTALFIAVAAIQMAVWAKKKEKRYRSEFGDKYSKKRFSMLPGII